MVTMLDGQTRFEHNNASVAVIIGSGAGGGTLANEFARQGIDTVVLEAGALHTTADFLADEWAAFNQLSWLDPRTTSGSFRLARDFPNLPAWIVKAVGGTTVHWAGASLRIQPHEFRALSEYGPVKDANLLDWPLKYDDLAPYYANAEDRMGVTRTNNIKGLPGNNNFKVMYNGATKLGYKCNTGHMAINSETRNGRPACQQRGFCFQGCRFAAKWSTLYSELPEAIATGRLELRPESHVTRIEHGQNGLVTGVVYVDKDGNEQRQKARLVSVAGNAIETPRLLLNSESSRFPDGLANSSGQVGRNYMRHMTGSVYATFEEPVHMFRGTTMAGIISDEARHDPTRGFVGGYEIETLSLGLPFMAAFLDPGAWGSRFTEAMDQYENMAGMWLVGEDMPRESNRITLNKEVRDQYGLPVANVHYDDHDNDIAMREHAFNVGEKIYQAVGARNIYRTPPYPSTHNLGSCRMSAKAEEGVCNSFGQAHDIANLFISDGSQFTTSAAENPTLTIVALAIRQAEHIGKLMKEEQV